MRLPLVSSGRAWNSLLGRSALLSAFSETNMPGSNSNTSGESFSLPEEEQAASAAQPGDLRGKALTGTTVEPYLERIRGLASAGYTHVFLHQIGTDQDAFFRFAGERLLPALRATSHEAA